jgi:hypothetical protein
MSPQTTDFDQGTLERLPEQTVKFWLEFLGPILLLVAIPALVVLLTLFLG